MDHRRLGHGRESRDRLSMCLEVPDPPGGVFYPVTRSLAACTLISVAQNPDQPAPGGDLAHSLDAAVRELDLDRRGLRGHSAKMG